MSSLSETNTATIGIKIANGSYYPILQEGQVSRKRLVLTTVKDDQESVQIDLYKGAGDEIEDAVYIGSLVIEDIESAAAGEPEIELTLGLDGEGNLSATAGDNSTGDTQSLSVSMESLDEQGIYDIPEFDIDESFAPDPVITPEEESRLNDEYEDREEEPPRRRNPLLLLAFLLFGIAVIVLLAFLLPRILKGPEVPPLQAQNQTGPAVVAAPEPAPEAPAAVAEEPVAEPPAAIPEKPLPAAVTENPATPSPLPDGGVWYQLQWGDTLWDLSSSFYRDPFRYGQIAAENGIRNPDLIFAGRDIYIPDPRR
jgi:Hsp70 protein/LysM domain